jgi:hypothetical protein
MLIKNVKNRQKKCNITSTSSAKTINELGDGMEDATSEKQKNNNNEQNCVTTNFDILESIIFVLGRAGLYETENCMGQSGSKFIYSIIIILCFNLPQFASFSPTCFSFSCRITQEIDTVLVNSILSTGQMTRFFLAKYGLIAMATHQQCIILSHRP